MVVVDAMTYAANIRSLEPLVADRSIVFVKGDIRDADLMCCLFEEHRFTRIVHLAAESHVDRSITGAGDFVLTNDEVNPVIKALRANGIDVTAVHSHMLDEQPRLFFLHFWANDDALKLARGLRTALDKTASTRS